MPFQMTPLLRPPHGILFGFGTALLAVAWFTVIDSGRRAELEAIVFPTGAGDRRIYQPPPDLGLASEIVRLHGRVYRPAQLESIREPDDRMMAAGRDDAGSLTLYRRSAPGAEEGRLHLKTGTGQYLPLTPNEAQSPPPR
jgi:hypothetical protein